MEDFCYTVKVLGSDIVFSLYSFVHTANAACCDLKKKKFWKFSAFLESTLDLYSFQSLFSLTWKTLT